MEYNVGEETNETVEITELNDSESTEKFQKFIHELFEKNGVLNDLRAYLRGHLIEVLKSSETGIITPCQKNYTQRLELSIQALNALIAEYLLRLEFNFTLSIFTSEIPLSNMVFQFTKSLLKASQSTISELRFEDADIWSILNYLGIQCDSEHANKVAESYKSEKDTPLLSCILKSVPMYKKEFINVEKVHTSEDNLSSVKSDDSLDDIMKKSIKNKCKHYTVCKLCQNRILKLTEKYKKKKYKLDESLKTSERNALNVEVFMKNIDILEKSVIDEMFQQLKSVYEEEINMIRSDKEKKIKRSITNHALQLQKHREQLEEAFKARETELEENVQHRKQFLWNLAKELRVQRQRLAQAQEKLAQDELRVASEEKNLKIQIKNAEQTLKKRGEEMRIQITEELSILQKHLESIKQERDNVNKQKSEFEEYKIREETKQNQMKPHYELLKNEIIVLKKCIEAHQKSYVEKSSVTDVFLMNNENVGSCKSDVKVGRVVNDLKKRKNVNFDQENLEDTSNRHPAVSTNDFETQTQNHQQDIIEHLKDENERLKAFSRQQSDHIDRLSREHIRLQADIHRYRPKTAPSVMYHTQQSMNHCAGEHSAVSAPQPRVLFPGDAIPFIRAVGDRPTDDTRRRMLSQWRLSAPRLNQQRSDLFDTKVNNQAICIKDNVMNPHINTPKVTLNTKCTDHSEISENTKNDISILKNDKTRQKSPKSLLQEAKERLKNPQQQPPKEPATIRVKSPNATLREAKLRLRKLEIEAEAVQKSYLDFRKKQLEQNDNTILATDKNFVKHLKDLDTHPTKQKEIILPNFDKVIKSNDKFVYNESPEIKNNFNKYFREYQNISDTKLNYHITNSIIARVKPIPKIDSKVGKENTEINLDYLGTPLIEFRKLYHSSKSKRVTTKKSKNNIEVTADVRENEQKISQDMHTNMKIKESGEINTKNNAIDDIENKTFESPKVKTMNPIPIEIKVNENHLDVNDDPKSLNVSKIELNNNYNMLEDRLEVDTEVKIDENSKANDNYLDLDASNFHIQTDKEFELVENNFDTQENNNKVKVDIDNDIEPQKPANTLEETENNTDQNINRVIVNKMLDSEQNIEENIQPDNKNLLIVEVEHVHETSNIKTKSNQDLLVLVESSIDNDSIINNNEKISTQMTIIVSPKENKDLKSFSKVEELTENDTLKAIYMALEDNSSPELQSPNEKSVNEMDREYIDDFSADVDNYNSQEYDNNSPISLPKTSEDENFWDS